MKRDRGVFLSLVIPCYNEALRIGPGLKQIVDYLAREFHNRAVEVIVVDDGSTDKTVLLAKKGLETLPFKIVSHGQNLGKGSALKTGVLAASGKYVVFTDIDLSVPIRQIERLLVGLKKAPVVIGVRRAPQSKVILHQPKLREWLGQGFTRLTNWWLGLDVADATCGFKGFEGKTAHYLFSQSRLAGWVFDAEILWLARKAGLSVLQVPVTWAHDAHSKVKLGRDVWRSLLDLWCIKWWGWCGVYELKSRSRVVGSE